MKQINDRSSVLIATRHFYSDSLKIYSTRIFMPFYSNGLNIKIECPSSQLIHEKGKVGKSKKLKKQTRMVGFHWVLVAVENYLLRCLSKIFFWGKIALSSLIFEKKCKWIPNLYFNWFMIFIDLVAALFYWRGTSNEVKRRRDCCGDNFGLDRRVVWHEKWHHEERKIRSWDIYIFFFLFCKLRLHDIFSLEKVEHLLVTCIINDRLDKFQQTTIGRAYLSKFCG